LLGVGEFSLERVVIWKMGFRDLGEGFGADAMISSSPVLKFG